MVREHIEIRGSIKLSRRVERAFGLFALIALSCLFAVPLIITVSDSLKSFHEVYEMPRVWIPDPPRFSNFVQIFHMLPFHRFIANTVIITGLALFGRVLSGCIVGYSFARLRWPFRDFFFVVLLCTIMLPPQITMIPVFILFNKIGWVNTWLPLIVPAYFGGGVFNIFLMRQFFKTIPTSLEDAAKIDGCSTPRIFLTIMMPLAKPAIATICVLGFIGCWNDFEGPLIYLSDYLRYPISLGIYMFKSAEFMFANYVMAASLVAVLPVLVIFFSAQQYFVKGIVMTGIKG
ncbi:MAG TPA: carbohydrate ABC transporter permease [Candidatus Hydrogenedentes bacterium]|nr:carbohydrate ABC transporter permease [Candidatus Hydrogenedentota bacterium]HPG66744.1 carbohydrate ABC transporter permease [Candidatus Hydrogenedentota bacterium]